MWSAIDQGVLPTFRVVGAGMAGTTTLHALLGTLSQVFVSTPEEIEYVSHPAHPGYPPAWYARHFEAGRDHAIGASRR